MVGSKDTPLESGERISVASHGVRSNNVDRRGHTRKVPLEILCLGLSRSGTNSLRFALFDLGYSDVCHYSSVYENPKDRDLWVEALRAKYEGKGKPYGRQEFDALLGHCMAVTDTPAINFYKELLEAYPEAKVILTVRDTPEQWHSSVSHTILPFLDWKHTNRPGIYEWFYRYFTPKDALWHMNNLIRHRFMFADFENVGKMFYQGYNDEIQRIVPKERLLVLNVKEGWKPLCDFLGKEVPSHDFPRTNERAVLAANVQMMKAALDADIHKKMMGLATIVGALGVACIGAVYARLNQIW